jgi:arginyl-tRNA synthetase
MDINQIKNLILQAIKDCGYEFDKDVPLEISQYADVASSVAFLIKQGNPAEIANNIVSKITDTQGFQKIQAQGPFINFYFSDDSKAQILKNVLKDNNYGSDKINKTIVIDYSSPNIAKPFGIGHLRSTIIGQAIYNLYKFLGYKCIGDNHIGDWGTQFGKLIYQIKTKNIALESLTIDKLEELYIDFHKQNDPKLDQFARDEFKKLEQGETENIRIWAECKRISLAEFERIYDLLGVKIDYAYGESFYNELAEHIILELKEKQIAKLGDGAWIVEFSDMPPCVLEKSDGASTYFARDLASIKYRIEEFNPDIIAYEVGSEQALYWKQVFATAKMLGLNCQFKHIAHGLIRAKEGKFSTRQGNTIHLEDVINEAISRSKDVIKETSQDINDLAKQVGIGAIKYNDLSQDREKDIIFDWDKILNLKGNSGPYIQYAYVRSQSVLQKAGNFELTELPNKIEDNESRLISKIFWFPEVIKESANNFAPHTLCNYIFSLSQDFSNFYNANPIISTDDQSIKDFRLAICKAVGEILKTSLDILGIDAPERM